MRRLEDSKVVARDGPKLSTCVVSRGRLPTWYVQDVTIEGVPSGITDWPWSGFLLQYSFETLQRPCTEVLL